MSYSGSKKTLQMGQGGLMIDEAMNIVPLNKLIKANNVNIYEGILQKEFGSETLTQSALPAGVICVFDWWPNDWTQRIIALCRNGRVYRINDDYTFSEVIPDPSYSTLAPTTLTVGVQAHMIACGNEQQGSARKLFIFTGNDPVQVITGDSLFRHNIRAPAADWGTNNQPFFAFMYNQSLYALGNRNNPHQIYSNNATDHEDFATNTLFTSSIFPGQAQYLVSGFVYKSRQFVVKYPFGIYYLDDFTIPSTPHYVKLTDAFGGAAPHAACPALDDYLLATANGMVVSVQGSFQLSNVQTINILSTLKIESFMRQNTSAIGTFDRWAIYYEDKKKAMFTFRSPTGQSNNRILEIDLSKSKPEPLFNNKDQPNCLALVKDFQGVPRPVYGSDDGNIYKMDRQDRIALGSAYIGEFQIPYTDFGDTSQKIFEFVEVTFEPSGKWDLLCDVLSDGEFIETLHFPMYYDRVLAGAQSPDPTDFVLGQSKLGGRIPRSTRKRCHVIGRSISLHFYNSGYNQNFRVSEVSVYFRLAGQNQKGNK